MSHPGALPTAIVAGFPRCGTTWFHGLLGRCDDLFVPSARKEIHFFDRNWEKGLDWYSQWFDGSKQSDIRVDVTPDYAQQMDAAERIHSALGSDIRLLLLLRHPVRRLWSEYHHFHRTQRGLAGFRRWAGMEWHRSLYSPKVAAFRRAFGDNVMIQFYEELVRDPETANRALRHLGASHAEGLVHEELKRPSNQGFDPRFPRLHRLLHTALRAARYRHVPWVDHTANFARDIYLRIAPRGEGESYRQGLQTQDLRDLSQWYRADVRSLDELLGTDAATLWEIG